jgi:hypothetical protein
MTLVDDIGGIVPSISHSAWHAFAYKVTNKTYFLFFIAFDINIYKSLSNFMASKLLHIILSWLESTTSFFLELPHRSIYYSSPLIVWLLFTDVFTDPTTIRHCGHAVIFYYSNSSNLARRYSGHAS